MNKNDRKQITMTKNDLYFFMNYIRMYAEAIQGENQFESFFYARKIANFLKRFADIDSDEEIEQLYTVLNSKRKLIINQFNMLMTELEHKSTFIEDGLKMAHLQIDHKSLSTNLEELDDNSEDELILSAKMNEYADN